MAIYHLHSKMVSRADGRSVVAAAAYRSGELLYDQHVGKTFDYARKAGVEYSEILAPPEAPAWVHDRERLWNTVEQVERRKDAQLAREIEIALPVELSRDQQIGLLRNFVRDTFVSRGMVADVALHLDNSDNPHAHILLTTRGVTPEGFGAKRRDWNDRAELIEWRAGWAGAANEHLARAGLDIRIDHRTLEAQGIDLVPGRKIGLSLERQQEPGLPNSLLERVAEQREIAAENGRRILEDPGLALQAITHTQATFTERDIAKYLHTRTDGAEQFQAAYLKTTTAPELVTLGIDDRGRKRFTTLEMLTTERKMFDRAKHLAATREHAVSASHRAQALADGRGLSQQQREAFEYVVGEGDLRVLVGIAGAGKSTMLQSARLAWEAAGYTVKGAALAGIAVKGLESSSGITSRTLASLEWNWSKGRAQLGKRDVLVIDEAGLVGTRQLERVLAHAEKAGAKVVLVGDPEQLQAIEAGAPFRGIADQVGRTELTEVWRQQIEWQKEATRQLASGRTVEALNAYGREGLIRAVDTRDEARESLLTAWERDRREHPEKSQLMLAYTRDEVRQLNNRARELRRAAGELGRGEVIATERGDREFAAGDRLYFLKAEGSLGVVNGSLGTVEKIRDGMLQVRLDGDERQRVVVDSKQYPHIEHGYASTTHKNQGATVDRTYALATSHFDRHATYVALTRHRESATVFYGKEDFQSDWRQQPAEENFKAVLSRARLKDLAHDYPDQLNELRPSATEHVMEPKTETPASAMTAAERLRQRADLVAERLAAEREQQQPHQTLEQQHAERQKHHMLEQEIEQRKLDHDHGLEF